jgi:hypothetical protein
MSGKDRWYEELVRDFYQGLVQDEGFETVRVQHDVRIQGRSGTTHQIDIFWEFNLAGVAHRTAIECRRYNSKIKKSHVAAFHSVITDIACTNGVIVTTAGFQSGAVSYAEHQGIRLVLVNPMLREIHVKMDARFFDVRNWRFVLDQSHVDGMKERLGLNSIPFHIAGIPEDIRFSDAAGTPQGTLAELVAPYRCQTGEHELEVNAYLPSAHGPILVRAVGFEVTSQSIPSEFVVGGLSAARAVLEDLRSTPPKYLLPDGTISDCPGGDPPPAARAELNHVGHD